MSELGAQRHRARERALEIAYEASMKDRDVHVVLEELPVQPDPYTVELLKALEVGQEWAQDLIEANSRDWPLDRMPTVDRLVMMLALVELRGKDAPPRAVVLDEAVELAKVYSTDGSPSFVNGVLSACLNDGDFPSA